MSYTTVLMKRLQAIFAPYVPQRLNGRVRKMAHDTQRLLRPRPSWGNLRRLRPFSDFYGLDHGTAIDRVYIEEFLSQYSWAVRGRALEVGEAKYTRKFGTGVSHSDVLDIDPRNASATILADLDSQDSLPHNSFDCVILTQTLQYLVDPRVGLSNVWRAMAPGGMLLLSVPSICRVDASILRGRDHWRFTPSGLQTVLVKSCPDPAAFEILSFGNVLSCSSFIMGLTAEDLRADELEYHDPYFPLVVCAALRK